MVSSKEQTRGIVSRPRNSFVETREAVLVSWFHEERSRLGISPLVTKLRTNLGQKLSDKSSFKRGYKD